MYTDESEIKLASKTRIRYLQHHLMQQHRLIEYTDGKLANQSGTRRDQFSIFAIISTKSSEIISFFEEVR